jgi:hypothetical protein
MSCSSPDISVREIPCWPVHSEHICVCSHAGLEVSHCSKWITVPAWLSCHVAIGVILKRVICSRNRPVELTVVYSGVSSSVVLYVERSIPLSLLLPIERTIPNSLLLFQSWMECNCTLSRAQYLNFGLFWLCCTWCDCRWCRWCCCGNLCCIGSVVGSVAGAGAVAGVVAGFVLPSGGSVVGSVAGAGAVAGVVAGFVLPSGGVIVVGG